MPAVSRPTRSILALALVANVLAASAPVSAGTAQLAAARAETPSVVPDAPAAQREREPRPAPAGSSTTTASAERAIRAEWITRARPAALEPRAVGVAKATKPAPKPTPKAAT